MIDEERLRVWEANANVPGQWIHDGLPELIAEVRSLRARLAEAEARAKDAWEARDALDKNWETLHDALRAERDAARERVRVLEEVGNIAADAIYNVLPLTDGERVTTAKSLQANTLCNALAKLRAALEEKGE